jgi:hypothetical protein
MVMRFACWQLVCPWRDRAYFRLRGVMTAESRVGAAFAARGHLFFFEEVLIYLFQNEGFFDDNTAVMFDHESCKFGAVNEDKACIDAFCVVAGVGAETRSLACRRLTLTALGPGRKLDDPGRPAGVTYALENRQLKIRQQ